MKAHECYHCKQWVEAGQHHDCWTTTESALLDGLPDDLQEAYQRLRETAVDFGEQRVYASGSCIMFSRTSCYFFVRPKRQYLELAVFLGRTIRSSLVKRAEPKSKVKTAHIIQIRHRDEVESPISDWLKEAYEFEPLAKAAAKATPRVKRKAAKKPAARKQQKKTTAKRR